MVKNKRRIVLVDRQVQWAIVRLSLLQWLCLSLAALFFLAAVQVGVDGVLKPWSEHWQRIRPLATSMLLWLLLLLPKFTYDSFKFSNRFVGPVTRLRRALRELAEGKPFSPIRFRKGDYWQEMAEELNRAVAALTKQRAAEEPAATDHNESSCLEDLETVAT